MELLNIDDVISGFSNSTKCYNGTIIHLSKKLFKTGKGGKKIIQFTLIAERVLELFFPTDNSQQNVKRLIPLIRAIHDKFIPLVKNKKLYHQQILTFLNSEFHFNSIPSASDQTTNESPPRLQKSIIDKDLSPVRTRRDCNNCVSVKKSNLSLVKKFKDQKGTSVRFKKSAAALKKEINLRTKNQKIKRYQERIEQLKKSVKKQNIQLAYKAKKNVSSNNTIVELRKEIAGLKADNNRLEAKLKKLMSCLNRKAKELSQAQQYSEYMDCKVSDLEKDRLSQNIPSVTLKSGKGYSEAIRRCVYYQLISDVPVQSCGFLIKKVVEILFNIRIEKVPSPATCSQMAFELGVLASIHLMDFMLKQKSLCLSWDATTIEGSHVNEIHLTANREESLILDVRHLAGGKGSDYITHVTSALSDAASVYAQFHSLQTAEILTALKSAISCTLTDRAAVNAVVTRQLCSELDSELLLLNCNVHPLDSVAREVKKNLVKLDAQHEIGGSCFGSEGTAANLIKAISILRYKDGKGDPIGFKNFLHRHDIPVGTFPRYVGNRLHILFHLAGLVILHEEKLREFVEKESTAAGLLRSSILKDLKNTKIMVQVWALAVVGKTFTGPWMTKFYSSAFSNLEMGSLIKECMSRLQLWVDDVGVLLQPGWNVFGEKLDPALDDVLSSIHFYATEEVVFQQNVTESVIQSALSVLARQLSNFIDGPFSNPTPTMLAQAASAPSHNIASERALGSLDRLWRRAPNATMGFLNGKVRSKMNKTLQWLATKTSEESSRLILFVRKQARSERKKDTLDKVALCQEISQRRLEVANQREMTKRRSLIRELNKIISLKKDLSDLQFQCSAACVRRFENFLKSPDSIIGTLVFYCDQQVYGRIQSVKKSKLSISFWNLGQSECTCIDYKVNQSAFYADVILNKILFM